MPRSSTAGKGKDRLWYVWFLAALAGFVALHIAISGLPPLARGGILLSLLMLVSAVVSFRAWQKGYVKGTRALRRGLHVLFLAGPLCVLFQLIDPHAVDFVPPLLGIFAIWQISDSAFAAAFSQARSKLRAQGAPAEEATSGELWITPRVPWLLLLTIVLFCVSPIRWGARAARHATLPLTVTLVAFGSLHLYLRFRLRRLTEGVAGAEGAFSDLPLVTGESRGAPVLPAGVLWSVCVLGIALLWILGERGALFSNLKLTGAHLWLALLLFDGSVFRARREMKAFPKAVLGSIARGSAPAV